MIKAIFLDIDGVIVGTKKDINFPYPNQTVINGLRKYQDRGIPISLISAKPNFSATNETIIKADLDNFHVTDAGSLILNPISKTVHTKHPMSNRLIADLISQTDINEILWEIFAIDNLYVQKNVQAETLEIHEKILDIKAIKVDNIFDLTNSLDEIITVKIVYTPSQKQTLAELVKKFEKEVQFQWGGNPNLLPNAILNITAKGVSKRTGAKELAKIHNVSLENVLGVGDTLMDWEFIEECGYAGAMGNCTQEFLEKVHTKDKSKYYHGKHVDKDGVLDIIEHFDKLGEIAFKDNK